MGRNRAGAAALRDRRPRIRERRHTTLTGRRRLPERRPTLDPVDGLARRLDGTSRARLTPRRGAPRACGRRLRLGALRLGLDDHRVDRRPRRCDRVSRRRSRPAGAARAARLRLRNAVTRLLVATRRRGHPLRCGRRVPDAGDGRRVSLRRLARRSQAHELRPLRDGCAPTLDAPARRPQDQPRTITADAPRTRPRRGARRRADCDAVPPRRRNALQRLCGRARARRDHRRRRAARRCARLGARAAPPRSGAIGAEVPARLRAGADRDLDRERRDHERDESRRCSAMLGYTGDEFAQMHYTDVTHPDDRELAHAARARCGQPRRVRDRQALRAARTARTSTRTCNVALDVEDGLGDQPDRGRHRPPSSSRTSCARRRRWTRSASSPAGSRTTSTT